MLQKFARGSRPEQATGIVRRNSLKKMTMPAALFLALAPCLVLAGCTGFVNAQNKTQSAVQVLPASLDFGSIAPGKTASQTATLVNNGNEPVIISRASLSSERFSVSGIRFPLHVLPGTSSKFMVSFTGKKAGKTVGTLDLNSGTTDHPALSLSGTVSAPGPSLSASFASHDFGTVTVGTSVAMPLALSNVGGSDVNISAISLSSPSFTLSGFSLPLTIPSGGTVTGSLNYVPKAAAADNGSIAISSNDPLNPTIVVYAVGKGTNAPAGQLTALPGALSFGNVSAGSSATQVATIKNTGNANVTVSQVTSNAAVFSASGVTAPVLLVPGDAISLTVKFTPTAAGNASGNIVVASDSGAANIAVSGSSNQTGLNVSPSNIAFGSVVSGTTNTQTVQISNPGTSSITVSNAAVSGAGFSTAGLNFPFTLAGGQSTTFNVQFKPLSNTAVTGNVTIASNASNPTASIGLAGTGIAAGLTLSVNPSSVSFGSVNTGTVASRSVTLTNTGNSDVAISQIGLTGQSFAMTGGSAVTLAASQSITVTVQFSPASAGAASGNISISSNATGSPAAIALSGTGVTPTQHSVALSWNASGSAVAGYNVYRSTTSGAGYSQLNSGPDSNLTYSDLTVQNSQTYYYVTTAVDTAGKESTYSSEVLVAIP